MSVKKFKKSDLSSFSVNDSSIEVSAGRGSKTIKKVTRLHQDFSEDSEKLFLYIHDYISQLKSADIEIPRIINSSFNEKEILFICEYAGENITEYVKPVNFKNSHNNGKILDHIFSTLEKAQAANINFDPHPKNYVLSGDSITYVDFTPPWHKKYYDLRLSKASEKEKKILIEFFKCFDPREIGYHFAADLIKMDSGIYPHLSFLHKNLLARKIISLDYKKFLVRAEKVKTRELAREEAGIYLL